jgi:cystathionine gamma-synthase
MPNRPEGLETVPSEVVSIRAFEFGPIRIFAIFFPADKAGLVQPFWINAGVGISSRRAEQALKHVEDFKKIPVETPPAKADKGLQYMLCERIATLLERARIDRPFALAHDRKRISPSSDIYLFSTGMAAIYYVHTYLLKWRKTQSKTVMFGVPFHSTPHVFAEFGPGLEWMGLGTEYDTLEEFLKREAAEGRPVTAVWTEFPSNPLLVSSDLNRLRKLADKYKFALVVDETIGSFCSVDVLPVADIVVTSLTKSFSGYADVMGGSAVLNASSPLIQELKAYFDKFYHNDVYDADMEAFLKNSEDYLSRSKTLNDNANGLVQYLDNLSKDSNSSVRKVHYPTAAPTLSNYQAFMRPATKDFTPGYGCLFTVELHNLDSTIAFYDNLHVHHGPHLGAHRTLALPYTKAMYSKNLEEMEKWDLYPTQIRISVGLEPIDELKAVFEYAVGKADEVKSRTKEYVE